MKTKVNTNANKTKKDLNYVSSEFFSLLGRPAFGLDRHYYNQKRDQLFPQLHYMAILAGY